MLGLVLTISGDDPGDFSEKLDLRIHLLQIIGVLGAAGLILVLVGAVRSWRDHNVWWWSKLWNALVLLACVGYVWFVIYWNVLNFNLNY